MSQSKTICATTPNISGLILSEDTYIDFVLNSRPVRLELISFELWVLAELKMHAVDYWQMLFHDIAPPDNTRFATDVLTYLGLL